MEPLMVKNENYSFAFFKRLLENIKQTKDRQAPEDKSTNLVNQWVYNYIFYYFYYHYIFCHLMLLFFLIIIESLFQKPYVAEILQFVSVKKKRIFIFQFIVSLTSIKNT